MSHRLHRTGLQPYTLTAHRANYFSPSAGRGRRGWSNGQLWMRSEMKEDVRAMVREGSVGGQTSSTSSSMFELWVEMSRTVCNDNV